MVLLHGIYIYCFLDVIMLYCKSAKLKSLQLTVEGQVMHNSFFQIRGRIYKWRIKLSVELYLRKW